MQADAIDNPNFTKEKTFTLQTTKSLQEFAKIFHSISTLKGIQYYSHSNEKWTTLYHGAGFIENANSRKYLPDTYYTGANKAYFCLLDDNSLGDCVFKVSYTETSNEIRMDLLLVEPIKIWGITGVYPNNLAIQLKVTKTTSETLQASISTVCLEGAIIVLGCIIFSLFARPERPAPSRRPPSSEWTPC